MDILYQVSDLLSNCNFTTIHMDKLLRFTSISFPRKLLGGEVGQSLGTYYPCFVTECLVIDIRWIVPVLAYIDILLGPGRIAGDHDYGLSTLPLLARCVLIYEGLCKHRLSS
jgi:hypothetical protein